MKLLKKPTYNHLKTLSHTMTSGQPSSQPAVEPEPQEGQPVADALAAIAAQLKQLAASSAAVNDKVTALSGEVAATQVATLASAYLNGISTCTY
eukprot:SAG11_NODE_529_length_8721_cov_24.489330_5_plen_94_part_00